MPIFQLIKIKLSQNIDNLPRSGGIVILKLQKHLDYNSKKKREGGPQDLDIVFNR
jgi:hypothetical protein